MALLLNVVEVELNKNKPTYFVVSSNSCTFACKTNNMAKHNDTGKWGEEMAADYLRNSGYEIIERDWRDGHRDIDIIARSPDLRTIVFVEVKTRATDVITKPEEAVDRRKIRNIGMAADSYVKMLNVLDELRFDVISVIGGTKETAQVEHIVDAFNPCMAF